MITGDRILASRLGLRTVLLSLDRSGFRRCPRSYGALSHRAFLGLMGRIVNSRSFVRGPVATAFNRQLIAAWRNTL